MSKRKIAASLGVGATAAVECASSRSNDYATATLAPSKGRLMRCTVDGLTPNRSAMTRMPGRPGVARATRIRCSVSAGTRGRPGLCGGQADHCTGRGKARGLARSERPPNQKMPISWP